MTSLNFDATELQIFKDNLGAQVTQIASMNILRLTIDFIKMSKVWSLCMEFYGAWQLLAVRHRTPYIRTKLRHFYKVNHNFHRSDLGNLGY